MKKRVLSMLLAMVMVLSTAALAISATDTGADIETTTYPVAQNVNGMIINIDGVRDAGEGWGDTPLFQTKYKMSDPATIFVDADGDGKLDSETTVDENGCAEAIVEDTNPSSLYISTDGKYVYFFYETTHSDFINGHEDPSASGNNWIGATNYSGGTSWASAALQFFFAPVGVDLEATNVEDHEAFKLSVRTITDDSYANNVVETALTTGNQTYIWDHKMGDDNKEANGGAWDASQDWSARYFVSSVNNGKPEAGVEGVTYQQYSQEVLDDTHIALRVEGDPSCFTKMCVEIAFPISEELSEQLQTGTADYRIGTYEFTHRFNEDTVKRGGTVTTIPQNAGYALSERILSATDEEENTIKQNWCFTANCGVTFTLPQTSEKASQVAEPNFYSSVTVDGIMGDGEGWSASPMFQTSVYASDCQMNENTLKQEDTSPTNIRISCNGQKVYFFIEITHEETLSAIWRDMNAGKTDANGNALEKNWQTACLVMHFYPDNEKPRSEYGADNGEWFTLALATFYLSGLKDSLFDENGTYVWDMNVDQGAVSGRSDDFFWRFLWGSQSNNNYSKEFCQAGVELAAHIDKNEEGKRTKLSVEFAFPLAPEVVANLEEGDLPYKFTYWERNNVYKDLSQENPTEIVNRDAGYFLDDTYVDTRVKNDTDDPGKPVILKQNTDTTYSDFIRWRDEYKESAEYENLANLVVNLYGDDYLMGGKLSEYYKWYNIMDEIYNWDIKDYNEAGIMTSTFDDIQLYPLCRNYRNMSANNPNVVIVSGGWNDYLNGTPIGTITDTDTDTYMGALNTLITGLRTKYRDACIIFHTVYNFTGTVEGGTLTSEDYANAMKQVCEARDVYCFNAYDPEVSGIDMSDDEFRATYCVSATDTVNLNVEGVKLITPNYEKFISESLTHWAANKDQILADFDESQKKDDTTDSGNNNTQNGGNNNTTETTPTETTPAPTEPAKKGCGSVIGVGSALAVLAIVSCAGAVCFKKHD